jgi:hypothetical protein
MKAITILAALMLGTAANAFPAHQQDGYRDTGCDPAQQVQITNEAGEYLYSNNPTCASVGGGGNHADFVAAYLAAFPAAPVKEAPAKK